MRIIGLDPGLRRTGWGVIEADPPRLSHVANGVVTTDDKRDLADRLVQLHDGLAAVLRAPMSRRGRRRRGLPGQQEPDGHPEARHGSGHSPPGAGLAGLPVAEYLPNIVKKAVVGTGHAAKEQIQVMVRHLLPGVEIVQRRRGRRLGRRHLSQPPRGDPGALGGLGSSSRRRRKRLPAMIGKLTGRLDSLGADWAMIDVGGVGYVIFASRRTLERSRPAGRPGQRLGRDPRARGPHPSLRLRRPGRARLVPPAVDGAGGRRPHGAGGALGARAGRSDPRHRGPGQGGPDPGQRRRPQARRSASSPSSRTRPATWPGPGRQPARRGGGLAPGQPADDALSALVNLGYGRSEALGAVAEAIRSAWVTRRPRAS